MVVEDNARNREIRKRRRSETLASIGKDYELSRERIRQICIGIPKPRIGYIPRTIKQTMRTKTIYGLYVEGENMPRYVGASHDIKNRIRAHRRAIRFTKALYRVDLPDLGLQIKVIEEVDEGNWSTRELYWINHFIARGAELANADPEEKHIKLCKAGNGKYIRTPEIRKKIGQSTKRGHRLKRESLSKMDI